LTLRILSLREIMRKYDVWGLSMLLKHLDDDKESVKAFIDSGSRDDLVPPDGVKLYATNVLQMAQYQAAQLGLHATNARVRDGGGVFFFAIVRGLTWQELYNELSVLRDAILADLEQCMFAFVMPDKAMYIHRAPDKAMYIHRAKDMWSDIISEVPGARHDVQEATFCYALERDSACVFHSMRVAEHGLRHLARKLKITLRDKGVVCPIELNDWEKIITGCNSKITEVRKLPKSSRRTNQLQYFSDAADHGTYMKDIWRNEVSHARKAYNAGEALGVFTRVHSFMEFLVKGMRHGIKKK
jgi:hypothetical protein